MKSASLPPPSIAAVRGLVAEPGRLKAMGEAALAAAPGHDRVGEAGKFEAVMERLRG